MLMGIVCDSAKKNDSDSYVERPLARSILLKTSRWTVRSYVRPMNASTITIDALNGAQASSLHSASRKNGRRLLSRKQGIEMRQSKAPPVTIARCLIRPLEEVSIGSNALG